MADLNSIIAAKVPWLHAEDISDATPTVAVLVGSKMPTGTATEIVASIAAGSTIANIMAMGVPALAATEIYNTINP